MLFSAIRAKGGFNNNPTVSQFEAAYKSIIVHSEIKSSSSANCMALDDTTILRVSSSNIKVKDTQSELLDLLCVAGTDDLENDNLLSVNQHSNFINDVVACIAGFVVRKIKKNNLIFNTKSSSSGLKLMTYSINAYRQIIKFLEINNMNFHTYQTNEEKAFRVVIRHLHHTTPTDYIKEELHSLGFITRSITNCLQYKTKNPIPLFFVDLEPSPSNHNIYRVDSICYTKIKIEAPHPKKNPVQCLKCQNYGHTRTYCHHTPRCVKCGDIHLSSECQKDSNTPATCALCSGDHPASYKGCPKFKLLQKGRSTIKTNRPTETQDSSTSIKTNTIQENNFPPLCQPQWSTSQSTTIQNLPNTHSHPKKNQNLTEPCVNPNTDSVTTQLTNFLVQFQSLVK
ncbi:hypothetical protein QTP88_000139 [Uroleucon formosanum]